MIFVRAKVENFEIDFCGQKVKINRLINFCENYKKAAFKKSI